uniref:N-acetyltransferase domain-containing protein n=1 Tax=Chromera velia CCMP2878 TaxID=1169474 RepID=A0A0G4FKC1_9ALVE|eukprot:Cvel_17405.t1-p1 / transcript=Cvel_17405.t1 / gene=Cvel_17405 / organism=Chromera_velia_CCMP2878 / gene_product=hypothetical protein / transcript_product=hypothetical protein / location=Cvel_scaffold1386:18772-21423(+) / protein_length=351 / sequence_SO=supercontig / SO=protein_coding / is_pseudo=false
MSSAEKEKKRDDKTSPDPGKDKQTEWYSRPEPPQRSHSTYVIDRLPSGLVIRTFEEGDKEEVKRLVHRHVRSQVLPAAKFWVFRNFSHLCVLTVILFLFLEFWRLVCVLVIFHVYLLLRSWWEFESYIRESSDELNDIHAQYLSQPRKHFWIAELNPSKEKGAGKRGDRERKGPVSRREKKPEETAGASPPPPPPRGTIVGCVGVAPMREDPERLCQVYRLVVAPHIRRLHVGSYLLDTVHGWAEKHGFSESRMIANNLLPYIHFFYRKNGYEVLYTAQRALMRGDLIAYRKVLKEEPVVEGDGGGQGGEGVGSAAGEDSQRRGRLGTAQSPVMTQKEEVAKGPLLAEGQI